MAQLKKLKVVEVTPLESGAFTNKLNFREDKIIKDDVFGDVVKTTNEYYYVKTAKNVMKVDAEIELDMDKYEQEVSEFKNTDEESAYFGETMSSVWLTPKK